MKNQQLAGIAEALDVLAAAGGARPATSLTPAELVAVNQAFGALKRHVDAAFAPVAAEISRQSRRELGNDSLAKKQGFSSPAIFISTTTGTSVGEAVRIVRSVRRRLVASRSPANSCPPSTRTSPMLSHPVASE